MKKVNIIIPKRNRDEYLKLFLYNLNLCNNISDYDVMVYIGEDIKENVNKINFSIYNNIKIKHIYIENLKEADNLFCRGYLIHKLLEQMREDYDWFSLVDVDIVYTKNFLNDINILLKKEKRSIICKGNLLEKGNDYKKILKENYDFNYIIRNYSFIKSKGFSQATVTKDDHEKIKSKLKIKSLYDVGSLGEQFIGYGGEDVIVTRILQYLTNIKYITNKWIHIWHERQEIIKEKHNKNKSIINKLNKIIRERIK
jgi:hypothetical protein